MDHIVCIHSSADGYLSCVHSVVHRAAVNMCVQGFVYIPVPVLWGTYPRVEVLDHMVIFFKNVETLFLLSHFTDEETAAQRS